MILFSPNPKNTGLTCLPFRVEKYSWRDQESVLNTSFPQYRTSISLPTHDASLRIHFIHVPSPHPNAIPLLLLPPFPFTNLSLAHLIPALTSGEDQPFHLVIPSLPGLGFSDPLPNPLAESPISATASLFSNLMTARLRYPRYIASTSSPETETDTNWPSVDTDIISHLVVTYSEHCVGAHLISPKLERPSLARAPWAWAKWAVARFFRAGICGYDEEDWKALDLVGGSSGLGAGTATTAEGRGGEREGRIGRLTEPNSLAYALCDSPAGMLALILRARALLRGDSDSDDGGRRIFSPEQLITATMLAWLPGPEHALRFWAGSEIYRPFIMPGGKPKPKIGITIFHPVHSTGVVAAKEYICPAWASTTYDVVCTHRHGKSLKEKMGLLAFTHSEIIIGGTRALAKALLEGDPHIFETGAALAPFEKVVFVKDEAGKPAREVKGKEKEADRGGEILQTGWGGEGDQEGQGEDTDGDKEGDSDMGKGKGKEKEKEKGEAGLLPPRALISMRELDEESPDTLVEGSKTPMLEKTT